MADEARQRVAARLIGRANEQARFRTALAGDRSIALWFFGPGGIGKSALCWTFAEIAARASCSVTTVDLRATAPNRDAFMASLAPPSDCSGRRVVILDTFERIAHLETWARSAILDILPTGTVVVIASRTAPSMDWRADPGWSSLLETIPLRGLSPSESADVLVGAGVTAARAAEVAPLASGNPLALVLLAEFLQHDQRRPIEDLVRTPDLVAALLSRLVDDAPTRDHRRLLDAAAMTKAVDRGLIRHLVPDGDADELFDWLRSRPFIESVSGGLLPHDLVRTALEDELRRTDPGAYAALHHQIREYLLSERGRPGGTAAAVQGIVYLHRNSSLMSSYWDWTTYGAVDASGLRAGDAHQLARIVAAAPGGDAELPILEHWLERQPEAFTVVRSASGEVLGFVTCLVLDTPTDADLQVDPTVAAVWRHASRHDPPRPGQVIGVHRYFEDREHGQGPSATFNVVSWVCCELWISVPELSWFYIAAVRDPGFWAPMMRYLDFHPVQEATHAVGTSTRYVYCHDWRRVGAGAWLDLMERRELGGEVGPAPPAPVLVALDREEFGAAARAALRELARPDRLARNPLTTSRLVRDHPANGQADLAEVMRAALEALPDDPRNSTPRRCVDRTYFHGAISQEAAAEVLGLAYSTYRRHLHAGTALLIEQLWQWELYGRS